MFVPIHSVRDRKYNDDLYKALHKTKYNIVTKTTNDHAHHEFENTFDSSRFGDVTNHSDICYEALKEADVVVSNYWGTMGLFAAYMDIPLIVVDQFEHTRYFDFVLTKMNYAPRYAIAEVCGMDNIEETIDAVLANPDKRKEERKNVAEYYLNKGYNDNVIENIINEIQKTYGGDGSG